MIKIKFLNKLLVFSFFYFSINTVKSQTGNVFPLLDKVDQRLEKVFLKEDSTIREVIHDMDAILYFDKRDSILEIYYMDRSAFYNYLLSNSSSIYGIFINNQLLAIDRGAKEFFKFQSESQMSSSILIKKRKNNSKNLIEIPEPTEFRYSKYKQIQSGFKFINRNFLVSE